MKEAISLCEEFSGREMNTSYADENRIGDHIWWISDIRKFQKHYPEWHLTYSLRDILEELITSFSDPGKSS